MKIRPITTAALLVAVAFTANFVAAQAQSKKIRGTLVAVNDTGLVVNDGQADQTVPTVESTAYHSADAKTGRFTAVPRNDLRPGLFVSVTFDDANATGAKNVWVAGDEKTLSATFVAAAKPAAKSVDADAAPAAGPAPATRPLAASKPAVDGSDTTAARVKSGKLAHRFMELHNQYVARAKQGDVDIVFLGDSITQGWEKAPELWKSRYEPLKAVNFGISGDVIQHVLWRVEHGEFDGITPKVCVLLVGTNNTERKDAAPIATGVKHLIDVIHSKTPTTKVLLLAIFPRHKPTDGPHMSHNIELVNPMLAKLDDGKLVRFLDVNKNFYDADGKFREELFSDSLHPNPAGYQVIADAMQPMLDEMLKP